MPVTPASTQTSRWSELVAGYFGFPAWPAFMAMIFFFVEHMDPKKAPHILVGGVFGIGRLMSAGARAQAPSQGS